MNAVGLNHRVASRLSLTAFFDLAVELDIKDVEIRSDLPGVSIADGTPAETVRRCNRLNTLGQAHTLIARGFTGSLSFEPFADSVSDASDIRSLLADSIAFVRQADGVPAR